jgi:hypothetical protein
MWRARILRNRRRLVNDERGDSVVTADANTDMTRMLTPVLRVKYANSWDCAGRALSAGVHQFGATSEIRCIESRRSVRCAGQRSKLGILVTKSMSKVVRPNANRARKAQLSGSVGNPLAIVGNTVRACHSWTFTSKRRLTT